MKSPIDTGRLPRFEGNDLEIGFCDPQTTKPGWSLVPIPTFFSAPEYVRHILYLLANIGEPGRGNLSSCISSLKFVVLIYPRSRVVDDLQSRPSSTESVGYIYFDYNDPKSFQPENIVRSLLKQLLFNLSTIPDVIETHHKDCSKKGKSVDIATLKQQLLLTIPTFDRVFLLFDALDEIPTEYSKEVMSLMSNFRNAGARLFCTSRINTARIRGELGSPAVTEIRANHDDIVDYITGRLDQEYDYDEESKQTILDCLVEKADGK
jgi:hypothetical protein